METWKLIIAILISVLFNISSAVPLWLFRPLNFNPSPPPPKPAPTPEPVPGPSPMPQPPHPSSKPPSPSAPNPMPQPPSPAPHPATKPPSPSPAAPHPAPMHAPAPHRGNSSTKTCPIDTMKLGACVDLLGGLIHIQIGDPAIDECCPLLGGLMGMEAALCFCTSFTLRMLNMTVFMPVALELIATCGMNPPPGYACGDLTPKNNSTAPPAS